MSYKQLFLLILTIWCAEVTTRFMFDSVVPKKMEYRTYYMEAHEDGQFYGKDLEEFGDAGWELVNVIPGPTRGNAICFFKKQTILK